MSYDDETLMAYADGELDASLRAQIAAAIEKDPALARRIEQHRALRAEVSGAFGGVLDRPIPERLKAAARGAARGDEGGKVVQFPKRGTRAPGPPWGAREWTAMAASLLLGVLISWRSFAPRASITESGGALVARGALAAALDAQLASNQAGDDDVRIGLTFEARDGGYCRSFSLRATGTAGLACRAGGEWRIPATAAVEAATGGMQPASGTPPAILQAIESRIAGEPLDAAAEDAARGAGWSGRK
jgi:anti-sigma factor RsiW